MLLSPPTGQSDWCLSRDFVQNQICKFSGRDSAVLVIACQQPYLARKTRLRVGFRLHLVSYEAEVAQSGVFFSADFRVRQLRGRSNLYELSSICSVKFDVEAFTPSALSVHVSLSRPPGFPHFIACSQPSGDHSLLTA